MLYRALIFLGAFWLLLSQAGCDQAKSQSLAMPTPYRFQPLVSPTPRPAAGMVYKKLPTPAPKPSGWINIQADRWDRATVRPEKQHFVDAIVWRIERNKDRYQAVSKQAGVPWEVIASIHNMEASLSFKTNLSNGDPLTSRTRHVPAGRPPTGSPPFSWEAAAVDALQHDHMGDRNWSSIGSKLQNIEAYNGLGYQHLHGDVPSPYLWSWTSLYDPPRGKFIADGQWSSTASSSQCGAVPILKGLMP